MNKTKDWLAGAIARAAVARVKEEHRQEIERAVDNAKRSAWDKWFRREWYRTAALRKQGREAACRESWRRTRRRELDSRGWSGWRRQSER